MIYFGKFNLWKLIEKKTFTATMSTIYRSNFYDVDSIGNFSAGDHAQSGVKFEQTIKKKCHKLIGRKKLKKNMVELASWENVCITGSAGKAARSSSGSPPGGQKAVVKIIEA